MQTMQYGMPGTGKTQLVRKWAKWARKQKKSVTLKKMSRPRIPKDWAGVPIIEHQHTKRLTVDETGLVRMECGHFPNNILTIKFEDGSRIVYKSALVFEGPHEIAVLTEHCGYHVYRTKPTGCMRYTLKGD